MSVLAALLLGSPGLLLSDLQDMSSAEVGERVLEGRDHGPIVSIELPRNTGMAPPGMVTVLLDEQPVRTGAGCTRTRWRATFRQPAEGLDPGTPLGLTNVLPIREVAFSRDLPCLLADYASFDGDGAEDDAIAFLGRLENLGTEQPTPRFDCSDETGRGLCGSPSYIASEISRLSAWRLRQSDTGYEAWLGERGGVLTSVTFDPDQPDRFEVERRIPAPF